MGWSILLQPQNREVVTKLVKTTCMMFFLPVATFYICYWYVFVEKTNPDAWAGGAAVIVANLVLAHYVVTAFAEDDDEVSDKDNDQYGPRTGVFKQRTD